MLSSTKLLLITSFLCAATVRGVAQYQPKPVSISSPWAKDVNTSNAWQEYPRPQLVRSQWINLNGLWNYAEVPLHAEAPSSYQGQILVPYAIESSLSGVQKALSPQQELWYEKTVELPAGWKGQNILLHFGAVDWQTSVYVNGTLAGTHTGGSDPFTFNITPFLKSGKQQIKVKVFDPTDTSIQPRGKQSLNPRGFWYTAVSGIWQTVWMEPVQPTHIADLYPVPDIDNSKVTFHTSVNQPQGNEQLKINISYKGTSVKQVTLPYNAGVTVDVPQAKLWSPDAPNIYHASIALVRNGKVIDNFTTYFAMRKVSLGTDANGYTRIMLNNKPTFMWGTLDQGWWPESLLTPPTDEAMKADMVMLKNMGFNMIRKHIKVEPARYYYHADTLGMLIWQDMPSGFLGLNDPMQHVKFDAPTDWNRPKESADDFKMEWKSIIDHLRFFPSIVVWVPFNEGWGQFETKPVVQWTQNYDKSRLVDGTSGWTDRKVGNMFDAHQYPGPSIEPASQNPGRALVLGEFGGLGWPIKGHLWNENKRNWGYRTYVSQEQFDKEFTKVITNLYPLLARGMSAAIYTQTTDVEGEVNGLATYDRKYLKIPVDRVKALSLPLYRPAGKAQMLISDSEEKKSPLYVSYNNPGANWYSMAPTDGHFKQYDGQLSIKKGQQIWAVNQFNITDMPKNLGMKLFAQGNMKIYLNGEKVYDNNNILTKRHYDEVNISSYKHLLKPGKNNIAVELTGGDNDADFDFGLYSYN